MFRFIVAALAVVGVVSLLSQGSVLGIGAVLLAPFFFLAKVLFFMMMFSFFFRAVGYRRMGWSHGPRGHHWKIQNWEGRPTYWMSQARSGRWQPERGRPADPTRFEEWQRMQEARKEVDGWVEDLENGDPDKL